MLRFFRARRRARLRAQPFPPAWRAIIERNFPLFLRLPEADREELLGHVQVFLAEKRFEGCGGLELTDEIRVTIAVHACLLLLHRDDDYYPRLLSILVYPAAYIAPQREVTPDGVVHEGPSGRLGESWQDGALVLSWDDVRGPAADPRVPHDVVIHEFAHQLDQEDGHADGAPILPARQMYAAWARVLSVEFDRLRQDAVRGRKTVLDTYGATNPAEFFAVATEAFFKNAHRMRERHPELYEELREFYRQDPAAYGGE